MRFDDRVTGNVRTYAPYARIVHVDIDPAEIGKNVAVEVPDRRRRGARPARPDPDGRRRDPATSAPTTSTSWPSGGATPRAPRWHGSGAWRDGLLSADYVVERIGELTDHEATYVADVGQNQMWLARYAGFRDPNSHVCSGGLGHDGLLPSRRRWARRSAGPDRETWAITGDGGFQMTFQELMTLVADRHPGQDRAPRQQEARDDPPVAGDHLRGQLPLGPPARARTSPSSPTRTASRRSGRRTPDEVDDAIRAAQAVDGPALIWFEIAEEQNVFPMMPAGKGLSDLIEKWGGADE